jgi:hypothetical protein
MVMEAAPDHVERVVRLVLRPREEHVRWTEDVVDNEFMGKRSSKGA